MKARLLLGCGALLLALGAAELLLRLLDVGAPAPPVVLRSLWESAEPFTEPDADLIYRLVPHAKTHPSYRINARGYRTPDFESAPGPGVLRVVATGDSSTFGMGVREEDAWPAVLRGALADAEVIAAGVPGYTTFLHRRQIERDLLPLQPDVLVLALTCYNDTRLVTGGTDEEVLRRSWFSRLRLARLLGVADALDRRSNPGTEEPGSEPRVPPDEVAEHLRAIAAACRDADTELVVLLFPPHETIPGHERLREFGEVVARVCADEGVTLADARSLFDKLPLPAAYVDSIHPTPYGHGQLAMLVLDVLPQRRDLPEIEELYAAGIDARLRAGDRSLPAAVLNWDPLLGRRARHRSSGACLLAGDAERLAQIEAYGVPADRWVESLGGPEKFLVATPEQRQSARVRVACEAALGLPVGRVDRRTEAAATADPEVALALLDEVLELDPTDVEARLMRAQALRRTRHGQQAREELEQIAEMDPDGLSGALAAGLLAVQALDPEGAVPHLRRATGLLPASGLGHYLLGGALFELERLDEAARELLQARALFGSLPDADAMLAEIDARTR